MFYLPLKIAVRLALKLYCPRVYTEGISVLGQPGPLLLASNHPNSFLDALLIASRCRSKTFILVRGDVFKKKWADYLLRRLYCLPIYRMSEGRSLLGRNGNTFDSCLDIFKKGQNVLIFCEGVCENEWALRAIGKGTARLAFLAWQRQELSRLPVIPLGLSYQNFDSAGKTVFLLAGEELHADLFREPEDAKKLNRFNERLRHALHRLILQLPSGNAAVPHLQLWMQQMRLSGKEKAGQALRELQQKVDNAAPAPAARGEGDRRKASFRLAAAILFPLVLAGWLIHAPLYFPLKRLTAAKTKGTVFHDSVLFALLFVTYPLYLILLAAILFLIFKSYGCCLVFPAAPVLAGLTVRHLPFRKKG